MAGLSDAFERVGTALEHLLENSHAAGVALAITDREEILGVAVRGVSDAAAATPVRPETRFQIGSISKSFSGIVALQEVAAGRLDLHVSVNEILPWLGLPEPFGPITLHHLMSHTSGLATGTEDAPTLYGALHLLRGLPPTTAPGERFWYSNDGWKIVGACLERVTGVPIHELIRDRILIPAGMRSSVAAITDDERQDIAVGYEPLFSDRPAQLRHPLVPAHWVVTNTADGSIVSNVIDMSAYARLLLAGGALPDGERVLSEEMFELLTTPVIEDGEGGNYAYGLWREEVDGRTWIMHTGGMVGYTALLAVSPDDGLGVVILQNGSGSKYAVARHALAVVRASLAGEELPAPWVPPAATEIPKATEYAGRYAGEDGREMTVSPSDNGLGVTLGPLSVRLERDPLTERPGDGFLVAHPALDRFLLEFVRDEDGAVTGAFHGATWFGRDGVRVAPVPLPEGLRGYPGLYRNDDPWCPALRIVARRGGLALLWPSSASDEDTQGPLVPLGEGLFAIGTERDPCRVRFEGDADGLNVVVIYNGGRWYRSFED